MVAGRNLYPSDTVREFLVSENFVKRLGFTKPEDILNKEIDLWEGEMKGPIVGVMKDFNALNLRKAIEPVLVTTEKEFLCKSRN